MTPLEIFGHIGNACFFSRWVVQWIASERAQESRAPKSFFWLSLAGTAILLTYTIASDEQLLLAGFSANMVFYARNLALAYRPRPKRGLLAHAVIGGALLLFAVLVVRGATHESREGESPLWLACGVAGQIVFGSRFAVQWWFSEIRGRSHFPQLFWWMSLVGNALLLAYTGNLGDWVLIVGQVTAWVVPLRNLWLEQRRSQRLREAAASAVAGTPACQQAAER